MSSWRHRVALLLVLTAAAAGCSSDEERFRAHHQRADRYQAQGKTGEQLIELRNALALQPQDPETNFQIARVLEEQGRPRQAVYYYSEVRRLDRTRVEAYLAEARLFLGVDTARAAELGSQALDLNLAKAPVRVLLARVALERGDALAAYELALAATLLEDELAEAHHVLGLACLARLQETEARGQAADPFLLQRALAGFERGAELGDPEDRWRSLVGSAAVLASWPGRVHEAGAAYRQAIDAATKSPEHEHSLIAVRAANDYALSIGDPALQRSLLNTAIEIDDSEMGAWLALARLEESDDGEPETVFARLLQRRARDPDAHATYAGWLAAHGRHREALLHLERALGNGIEAPSILAAEARIRLESGDREGFQRSVERLASEYAGHPSARRASALRVVADRPLSDALPVLRRLANEHDDPELQRLLGWVEFQLGHLEAASAAIARSLALAPVSEAPALALEVRVRASSRDWEPALAGLKRLNRLRSLDREEKLILARCFYNTARPTLGRGILERLVSGADPYLPAVLALADHEAEDSPEAARARLEAAHARAPEHVALLRRLTALETRLGQPERALARVEGALASRPDDPALLLTRSWIQEHRGRLDAADSDLRRALALAPADPEAVDMLTSLYRARGQIDRGIALLQHQENAGRLAAAGHELLGRFFFARGDLQQARVQYEEAIRQAAGSGNDVPLARNDLAFLLARSSEDLTRAHTLAMEAAASLPDAPLVLDTLGYVLLRRGLGAAAEDQFREAIRLAQARGRDRAIYHHHLGMALRQRRHDLGAAEAFGRALEIDPHFAEAEQARRERKAALADAPRGSER